MRPNVMLLVLDTARADAFEPYGAPPGSSPVVADLARAGAHAVHAYAPSSWTVPVHASMLTGALPRALGLGQAPGGRPEGVREVLASLEPVLLPAVLRDAGYTTYAASCNAWVSPPAGFDLGFDTFDWVRSPRGDGYAGGGWRDRLRWLRHGALARLDDGADEVARRLRAWLDGWDGSRPFFAFVNLVECHSPYLPPRPFNDRGLLERVRAALDVPRYQSLEAIWRHCTTGEPVPAAALERMRGQYALAIRALDAWLGRLVDLLADRGVLDDTILVVTSDHGENFGEGGLIGHAFSLDERLIRVPLVTRGLTLPDGPVGLGELPARIAAAAGLDRVPWTLPDRGSAVAQFDPLVPPDSPRLRELTSRWRLDEGGRRMFTEPLTCATDGRYKVLRWGDEERVFDLAGDPSEVQPLGDGAAGTAPAVEALRGVLARPEVWATPEAGRPLDATRSSGEETRQLEEQMRLLGYL